MAASDKANGEQSTAVSADPTGLDRMAWNVLSSWGSQFIFVMAGFILPRYVDGHLGQSALGVWDFGWSLVGYFGLAQVGSGSSVDRFVAKYREEKALERLNRAVSSVLYIQLVAAGIVLLATGLCTWLVPSLLSARLGSFATEARWVVFFLGTSSALRMAFGTYEGVLMGCHRWDLHNFFNAGFYGVCVVGMLISLSLGTGLRGLALIYCCGIALAGVARIPMAHRVCPGLQLRLGSVDWAEVRQMLIFGSKAFINDISSRLLYQTTSILIVTYVGPAAVAMFSRPMALVHLVRTFVSKFAYLLTPIVSQMDAAGSHGDVRGLLKRSTRYSVFLTLPPILGLIILGGPALRVWMGRDYEHGMLLAILAGGHLMTFAHCPIVRVLTGMGAHGGPALFSLLGAIGSAILCFLALGPLHGGLVSAAVAVGASLLVVDGIILPIYACRKLNLSPISYFLSTWCQPVLYGMPFAACLVAARLLLPPVGALAVSMIGGGTVLAGVYWRWVVPPIARDQIRGLLVRPAREGTHGIASGP